MRIQTTCNWCRNLSVLRFVKKRSCSCGEYRCEECGRSEVKEGVEFGVSGREILFNE